MLRVEDVRPVDMDHHVGLWVTDGVAVPGDMITAVEHRHLMSRLRQFAGDDRTRETSASNADVRHLDQPDTPWTRSRGRRPLRLPDSLTAATLMEAVYPARPPGHSPNV